MSSRTCRTALLLSFGALVACASTRPAGPTTVTLRTARGRITLRIPAGFTGGADPDGGASFLGDHVGVGNHIWISSLSYRLIPPGRRGGAPRRRFLALRRQLREELPKRCDVPEPRRRADGALEVAVKCANYSQPYGSTDVTRLYLFDGQILRLKAVCYTARAYKAAEAFFASLRFSPPPGAARGASTRPAGR